MMRVLLAIIGLAALLVACAPGNKGGSFSAASDSAIERGSGQGLAVRPPESPAAEAPAVPEEDQAPRVPSGDLLPSNPIFGGEEPGDFLVKPKYEVIHI